jgi:hypothetical protein
MVYGAAWVTAINWFGGGGIANSTSKALYLDHVDFIGANVYFDYATAGAITILNGSLVRGANVQFDCDGSSGQDVTTDIASTSYWEFREGEVLFDDQSVIVCSDAVTVSLSVINGNSARSFLYHPKMYRPVAYGAYELIDGDGNPHTITANVNYATINFVIDGGGAAITAGIKGDVEIDFDCTIQSVSLYADQAGSIVVDIWKDRYYNFPPTAADKITASAPPTLASAATSENSTLTGWTKSIDAGDVLRFNVNSAATVTRVTVSLKVVRS